MSMNGLARAVYALVTGRAAWRDLGALDLPAQERQALEALAPALRRSPQELAALLEQAATPLAWAGPPRSVGWGTRA